MASCERRMAMAGAHWLLLVGLGVPAGCAGPGAFPEAGSGATASQARLEGALRAAMSDAAALRAELAAARIAAAKQQADVDVLQRDLTQARRALAELQHVGDELRSVTELRQREQALQSREREQWQKDKADWQRELADVPLLRQALAASRTAEEQSRALVQKLEAARAAVTPASRAKRHAVAAGPAVGRPAAEAAADVASVNRARPTGPSSGDAHEEVAVFVTGLSATPGRGTVKVEEGDTLWSLARRHGITVERLKAENHLTTDHIRTGQPLFLPTNP